MRLFMNLPGPFGVSFGGGHRRRRPTLAQRRARRAARRARRAERSLRATTRLAGMSPRAYITLFAVLLAVAAVVIVVQWNAGLAVLAVVLYKLGTSWRLRVAATRRPAKPTDARDWTELPTLRHNPAAHSTTRRSHREGAHR